MVLAKPCRITSHKSGDRVALKVLLEIAAHLDVIQRFKSELLLAPKITHIAGGPVQISFREIAPIQRASPGGVNRVGVRRGKRLGEAHIPKAHLLASGLSVPTEQAV